MKRATVAIHLTSTGEHYEVSGYACEIDGLEFVVHHSCEGPNVIDGAPAFNAGRWTVTEPRTGRSVYFGQEGETRSQVVESASAVLARVGGAAAVERQVAALADAEGELLTTISERGRFQHEVAAVYAAAIRSGGQVDWPKVNAAIVERWSKHGLREVKRLAWEKVHQADPETALQTADGGGR